MKKHYTNKPSKAVDLPPPFTQNEDITDAGTFHFDTHKKPILLFKIFGLVKYLGEFVVMCVTLVAMCSALIAILQKSESWANTPLISPVKGEALATPLKRTAPNEEPTLPELSAPPAELSVPVETEPPKPIQRPSLIHRQKPDSLRCMLKGETVKVLTSPTPIDSNGILSKGSVRFLAAKPAILSVEGSLEITEQGTWLKLDYIHYYSGLGKANFAMYINLLELEKCMVVGH